MSVEIQVVCCDVGQLVFESDVELVCCIFDSLVLFYVWVFNELVVLCGYFFSQLYIVGGGCQNMLFNQLCVDVCGIVVVVGLIEVFIFGNIGIQLMIFDELVNVDEFCQVVCGNVVFIIFIFNFDSEIVCFVVQFQL